MKKVNVLLAVLMVVALLLAACGGTEAPEEATVPPTVAEQPTEAVVEQPTETEGPAPGRDARDEARDGHDPGGRRKHAAGLGPGVQRQVLTESLAERAERHGLLQPTVSAPGPGRPSPSRPRGSNGTRRART